MLWKISSDDLQAYVQSFPWPVSLSIEDYDSIVANAQLDIFDIAPDVLMSFDKVKSYKEALCFFILWNDLKNDWNRRSGFLTSLGKETPILDYMAVQHLFGISGITKFVFDYTEYPNCLIEIKRGEDFNLESHLDRKYVHHKLILGRDQSGLFDFLEKVDTSSLIRLDYTQTKSRLDYSILQLKDFLHNSYNSDIYEQFHELLLSALNEPVIRCFVDDIRHALKLFLNNRKYEDSLITSLALVNRLLGAYKSNTRLAYLFRTPLIIERGLGWRSGLKNQGGCMGCTLPPEASAINSTLVRVTEMLVMRGVAAQAKFRFHFELVQASRAAAASILARNMSHNIGSHVSPRTKIDNLKQRVRDLLIQDKNWDGGDWNDIAFPIISDLKNRLDEYIQRKAEFIAEFSTDPLLSTRSAWFFNELIMPFITNSAFIDTLAANEGFTYKSLDLPRLVIRCFHRNEKGTFQYKVKYRSEWLPANAFKWSEDATGAPYGMRNRDHILEKLYAETDFLDQSETRDVRISLPGPVGDMAVYSIFENIIRNAAKHGTRDRGPVGERTPLFLNVVIDEGIPTDQFCIIDLWDNLSDPMKLVDGKFLHEKMQELIDKDIIETDGELRKEAWGTAEMVLCANLLKGIVPGVNSIKPALSVTAEKKLTEKNRNNDDGKRLVYRFSIPKARTAIFFGWEKEHNGQEVDQVLASHGFLFVPLVELTEKLHSRFVTCDFAVINGKNLTLDQFANIYSQRHRIPFRIIFIGHLDSEMIAEVAMAEWLGKQCIFTNTPPPFNAPKMIAKWLWEKWIVCMQNEVPVGVDIYLEQKKDENPTSRWISNANEYFNANEDDRNQRSIPLKLRVWAHDKQNAIVCQTDSKEVQNKERRIVLDRHGNIAEECGIGGDAHDRIIFFDKSSADFNVLFNPSFVEPWTTPYELAEAGLIDILIIDERIAQRAMNQFVGRGSGKEAFQSAFNGQSGIPIKGWHVARKSGVHVATHIDIHPIPEDDKHIFSITTGDWLKDWQEKKPWTKITITEMSDNLTTEVKSNLDDKIDYNIVIVHQGIIDCLNGRIAGLGDRLLRSLNARYWLIVESGRGIPPEVQRTDYKFLSFTAIDKTFRAGSFAKLVLTHMAMSAARHKGGRLSS